MTTTQKPPVDRLRDAWQALQDAERQIRHLVTVARDPEDPEGDGRRHNWGEIGTALHMSRQGARQRYGHCDARHGDLRDGFRIVTPDQRDEEGNEYDPGSLTFDSHGRPILEWKEHYREGPRDRPYDGWLLSYGCGDTDFLVGHWLDEVDAAVAEAAGYVKRHNELGHECGST